MPATYAQRASASADSNFLSRVRLCSKEHALLVAQEPTTGSNYASRWRLAQALMQEAYQWTWVSELIVSDGTSLDLGWGVSVSDSDLAARVAAVFDQLAGPISYVPPPS